jgi:hypothetical protein
MPRRGSRSSGVGSQLQRMGAAVEIERWKAKRLMRVIAWIVRKCIPEDDYYVMHFVIRSVAVVVAAVGNDVVAVLCHTMLSRLILA